MQNLERPPSFFEEQRDKLITAIQSIKKRTRQEFVIVVADEEAVSLLDHLFSIVDRAKMGIIHVVERLEEKRDSKKYPIIYLISPKAESIQIIVNDFKTGAKYHSIDILALGTISNDAMALIKGNKAVKDPLKGFNQIFLDYIPWLDNAFSFGMKKSFLKMHTGNWINTTVRKLCSVLFSLQIFSCFEIIYPDQLEELATKLQKQLETSLQILKKYQYRSYSSTFPPTKVYLFPREFDYQSPLMRSYDYLSLIHNINTIPISQRRVGNIQLGSKDPIIWQTKYLNFPDAVDVVNRISQNENLKMDERDFDKNTVKAIKNAMDSNIMIGCIEEHLNLIKDLSDAAGDFQNITVLEQTVVNGVDQSGKKLSDNNIMKLIEEHFKQPINMKEKDLLQFIALCYLSLGVQNVDKLKSMTGYLESQSQKFKSVMTKLDIIPNKLKQKPASQRFDLFRHQPKVVHFMREIMFGSTIYKTRTKMAGEVEKLVRKIPKSNQMPKSVLFLTGYLGVNEVVALNRNNKNLIVGSNNIVNPWEYIWELMNVADG